MTALDPASVPRADRDPGAVGVGIQATLGTLAVALGLSGAIAAKWLLVGQLVVSLGTQLWVRAKAWPPAKVWLEAVAAHHGGLLEGIEAVPTPAPRKAARARAPRRR